MNREYMKKRLSMSMPGEVIMYIDPNFGRAYLVVNRVMENVIIGNRATASTTSKQVSISIDELVNHHAKIPIGWKSERERNEV